jgi:predicted transcriptional regulator of viral defense system
MPRYLDFRHHLYSQRVFSLKEARLLWPSFDRRRLSEWQSRGLVRKVVNGYYAFADTEADEDLLYLLAARIYRPSYVSLFTALHHHGLIPEAVHAVQSVSSRKTTAYDTPYGRFVYRTIAPRLYFGYAPLPGGGLVAEVEKALLDTLWLDRDRLGDSFDRPKFGVYTTRFGQKALARRAGALLDWMDHA